jgi:hypothetical protein
MVRCLATLETAKQKAQRHLLADDTDGDFEPQGVCRGSRGVLVPP